MPRLNHQILWQLIILSSLLPRPSLQKCGEGCLACDFLIDSCKVCDYGQGYYSDRKGGCDKISIENCVQINADGKCEYCEKRFRPNSLSGDCGPLPENKIIENCQFYDETDNCVICESGFYFKSASCRQVLVPIPDCELYMAERPEICIKCASGKILSKDATSCQTVPTDDNCVGYNVYDCSSCSSGYFFEPNAYIQKLISSPEQIYQFINDIKSGQVDLKLGDFCLPESIKNCSKFLYDSICFQCQDGYFRTDSGECILSPEEPLKNCAKYKGEGLCQECLSGFYLDNNQCKTVTTIENCAKYEIEDNLCAQCNDANYLLPNKTCTARNNSLGDANCQVFEVDQDQCDQCREGYVKDNNGVCAEGISDCVTYGGSIGNLSCTQCIDTYFYNSTQKWCEQPLDFATSPCLKYGNSKNECRECKQGFYMDSACTAHTQLDSNCSESSKTVANECSKCKSGYGLFNNSKVCASVDTPNSNCLKWRSATECDICALNYQAPSCTVIPIEENCVFKEEGSSNCSQCRDGYFQNSATGNLCITALDFEKANCQSFSLLTGSSTVQCDSCVKGAFFMEIENFYGCMGRSGYPGFDNCVMIDFDGSTNTCIKCKEGYYLDGTDCVETCPAGKIPGRTTISIDTTDSNRLGITAVNTCETQAAELANCEIIVPAVDTETQEFICAKCKDGFEKVYDLSGLNKTFNYNVDGDHYDDIVKREASFSCKALDMITDYSEDFCAVYGQVASGKMGCLTCQFGYTGYVKKPEAAEDVYLIPTCRSLNSCNTADSNILGLTTPESLTKWKIPLETFVSCSVCTAKDALPVILVRKVDDDSALSPIWYNILNFVTSEIPNTNVTAENSFGDVSTCLTTTVGSQFGYAEDFKVTYPEGCKFLLYRVDQDPSENLEGNEPTVYCVACDRGYRIAQRGAVATDIDVVRKCDMIPNCNQSVWFNYCSVCENGYVYKYDTATHRVQYDYCIEPPQGEDNCFATVEGGLCQICKKGFSKNDEGFCEDFNFANCSASTYLSRNHLYQGTVSDPVIWDFSSVLYFHGKGNLGSLRFGCSLCEGDFIGVKGLTSLGHCVKSSYIQKGQFNELRFIKSCLQFGWDYVNLKHVCRQCIPGFMPNFTGTKCVEKLNYCLRASSNGEKFCDQCQEGFTLINNQCVQNDITNCLEFGVEENALVCVKCSNDYYLYNKKFCLQGRIENCLQYNDNQPGKCKECRTEYAIFQIQTGDSLCVPFFGQNCNRWDPANTNGNFECEECQPNYFISSDITGHKSTLCFGPLNIEDCDQVSVRITSGNELDYNCETCADKYFQFNSGTSCLLLDTVDFCLTYSTTENRCEECENNYFLDYTGKRCIKYPEGIFGCQVYRSLSECFQCKSNMYLFNNECNAIDPPDWIENCLYYTSKELCSQCESGYILEKNVCKEASAVNCLAYANANTCESCPEGYGLMTLDKVTNCVLINIPNCEKTTLTHPFKCIICKKGFYQLDGGCFQADKILNCEYYLANKVCLSCSEGYIKSLDGLTCVAMEGLVFPMDANCNDSFLSPKRICAACGPGHFLSEGICKRCKTDEKCMLCNPTDSKQCLVCAPGTKMVSSGGCEGTPMASFAIDVVKEDDGDSEGGDKFAILWRLHVLWVLVFLMVE